MCIGRDCDMRTVWFFKVVIRGRNDLSGGSSRCSIRGPDRSSVSPHSPGEANSPSRA